MTFEEAKCFKKNLGYDIFEHEGIKFRVFIIPFKQGDFMNYLEEIKKWDRLPIDEDSKPFSSDNKFLVSGLARNGISRFIFKIVNIDS